MSNVYFVPADISDSPDLIADKLTELMKDLGDRKDQAIRATEARIESSRELVNELRHEIHLAFERLELAGSLMPAQAG